MTKKEKQDYIKSVYSNFEPIAYLFPTMNCNLNCYMCYSGSAMHKSVKNELSDAEYLEIVEALFDQGFRRFDISGGEPLMRSDLIVKISKKIREKGGKLQLVTNGTRLSHFVENSSITADLFDFIAVSLDSPIESIHNMIRGNDNAYNLTVEGIRKLVSNGFTIGINTVFLPENSNYLKELICLAEDLGVTFISFLRNRYVSPNLNSLEKEFEQLDWRDLYKEFESCIDSITEEILIIATIPQYIYQGYTNQIRTHFRNKENVLIRSDCMGGCGSFNNNIAITSDGNVTGCVAMINDSDFWVGNIREQTIKELLLQFDKWKKCLKVREKILYTDSVCHQCMSYHFCKGGCPVVAKRFYGDWKTNDPSCNTIYHS